jgi:hypothetical protein
LRFIFFIAPTRRRFSPANSQHREQVRERVIDAGDDRPVQGHVVDGVLGDRVLGQAVGGAGPEAAGQTLQLLGGERPAAGGGRGLGFGDGLGHGGRCGHGT